MRWTFAAAGLSAGLVLTGQFPAGLARAEDRIVLKPPPGVARYQPTIDEPVGPSQQAQTSVEPIVLRPPPGMTVERVSYQIGADEPALRPSILDRERAARAARTRKASYRPPEYRPMHDRMARGPSHGVAGDSMIQVGAYRDEAEAARRWNLLMISDAGTLSGASPRIVAVDLPGRGRYYRLRAGPLDKTAAAAICRALKARRHDCISVKS
jgi:hypothetical protein